MEIRMPSGWYMWVPNTRNLGMRQARHAEVRQMDARHSDVWCVAMGPSGWAAIGTGLFLLQCCTGSQSEFRVC